LETYQNKGLNIYDGLNIIDSWVGNFTISTPNFVIWGREGTFQEKVNVEDDTNRTSEEKNKNGH